MTPTAARTIVARSTARALATLVLGAAALTASWARAGESAAPPPTQAQIEAWLDARGMPADRDTASNGDPDAVPPPPPRKHGFVIETSIGALGPIGPLQHISPVAPWFHLQVGFEPLKWFMVFAETDFAFATTAYAAPPPEARSYLLSNFGGGLRFTVKPTDRFGIYAQGSFGGAKVSVDALKPYGFRDADQLNPYYGGSLGLEWYQVAPHAALAAHGGVRNYRMLFDRVNSSRTPLAWISGAALRYVF